MSFLLISHTLGAGHRDRMAAQPPTRCAEPAPCGWKGGPRGPLSCLHLSGARPQREQVWQRAWGLSCLPGVLPSPRLPPHACLVHSALCQAPSSALTWG